MKKYLAVIFLALMICDGCGIKGDPLPPAEQETVQKQNLEPAEKKETPATSSPAVKKKIKKSVKKVKDTTSNEN
ncbi:MAG: hypothetical protein WA160_07670 [Pseudobdellovibrio sp.]